jgi:threonine dehydratase
MPHMLDLSDIRGAAERIEGLVHRTPMLHSRLLGDLVDVRLWLKAEVFQKTGSFKVRGVFNKLAHLTTEERKAGLVSLSAGNHAAALSMAATAAGVPATIVMPSGAVPAKVEATQSYGGEVVLTDRSLLEVVGELQAQRGLTLVHPFDDPVVMAGQGTVGLEIVEDLPEVETVVVPCGGGGLLSGVAAAVKQLRPHVRVIGAEPEQSDVMSRSLEAGGPVSLPGPSTTIADGLGAPFAGVHTFAHVKELVDEVVRVPEEDIARAMLLLMERAKVWVEPAGAASYAALLSGACQLPAGTPTVCVLSGGNVNRAVLRDLL